MKRSRSNPAPFFFSSRSAIRFAAMIKRLDKLEVATADLADASSIYQKNFGFSVTRSPDGKSASMKVGGAEIRLVTGATIDSSSEGMIGLWLEAEDIDQVVANFHMAGLDAGTIEIDAGRRILTIDPKFAN